MSLRISLHSQHYTPSFMLPHHIDCDVVVDSLVVLIHMSGETPRSGALPQELISYKHSDLYVR